MKKIEYSEDAVVDSIIVFYTNVYTFLIKFTNRLPFLSACILAYIIIGVPILIFSDNSTTVKIVASLLFSFLGLAAGAILFAIYVSMKEAWKKGAENEKEKEEEKKESKN